MLYGTPNGFQRPPLGVQPNPSALKALSVGGLWLINEGTGPQFLDSSGGGYNAVQRSTSAFAWTRSGVRGLGTSFTTYGLSVAKGFSPPYSMIVNVQTNGSDGGSYLAIGDDSASPDHNGISLGIGSGTFDTQGNNIIILFQNTAWHDTGITWPIGVSQVICTTDGGSTIVYLNGHAIGSYGAPRNTATSTVILGDLGAANRSPLKNDLLSAMICTKVLSVSEISRLAEQPYWFMNPTVTALGRKWAVTTGGGGGAMTMPFRSLLGVGM